MGRVREEAPLGVCWTARGSSSIPFSVVASRPTSSCGAAARAAGGSDRRCARSHRPPRRAVNERLERATHQEGQRKRARGDLGRDERREERDHVQRFEPSVRRSAVEAATSTAPPTTESLRADEAAAPRARATRRRRRVRNCSGTPAACGAITRPPGERPVVGRASSERQGWCDDAVAAVHDFHERLGRTNGRVERPRGRESTGADSASCVTRWRGCGTCGRARREVPRDEQVDPKPRMTTAIIVASAEAITERSRRLIGQARSRRRARCGSTVAPRASAEGSRRSGRRRSREPRQPDLCERLVRGRRRAARA